jgi:hypothetical protein
LLKARLLEIGGRVPSNLGGFFRGYEADIIYGKFLGLVREYCIAYYRVKVSAQVRVSPRAEPKNTSRVIPV